VFKKYSQIQLQMKREALQKLNRDANEQKGLVLVQELIDGGFETVFATV
jgi:hypothetical protein